MAEKKVKKEKKVVIAEGAEQPTIKDDAHKDIIKKTDQPGYGMVEVTG